MLARGGGGASTRKKKHRASSRDFTTSARASDAETSSSSKPRGPLAIPRVRCETLSLARFRRDFVIPQRPVIIVGLGPHLTSDGANASDLRWLRKHGASKKVAVSVDNAHVASTLSCGGVEIVNLGDHLDVVSALDEDPPVNERDARFGKRRGDGSYLYDCAIPLKLPSLSHGVRVPRYFAHDFLQRTRMTHAFSASWPSLFVAAPHTRSSLHVDQWKGNFWMAMVKGTKRWTLFHREDIPFLSPDYGRGTLDPGFPSLVELDASRVSAANAATTTTRRGDGIGDSQKLDADAAASSARETETTHETPASHPFLEYARRWDCDLGPGEVLFVPGGWPHHVHNLCVTVSFAGNFVDESNLDDALFDMKLLGNKYGPQMMATHDALDEVWFDPEDETLVEETLEAKQLVVRVEDYRGGVASRWGKDDWDGATSDDDDDDDDGGGGGGGDGG